MTLEVVQAFSLGGGRIREDAIIGFTTADNALRIAEDAAEKHVAGWIAYLAGTPVEGFELATWVSVKGLERKRPYPKGSFTWQTEGCALAIAAGFDNRPELFHAFLDDYRTAGGRIERKHSASSQRAALICAKMDAGVHPRDAIDQHKLPPVRRDSSKPTTTSSDAAALAYYRELVATGEVCD